MVVRGQSSATSKQRMRIAGANAHLAGPVWTQQTEQLVVVNSEPGVLDSPVILGSWAAPPSTAQPPHPVPALHPLWVSWCWVQVPSQSPCLWADASYDWHTSQLVLGSSLSQSCFWAEMHHMTGKTSQLVLGSRLD